MSTTGPDLCSYDRIVVNSSAGKDSQAMLDRVVEMADDAGICRCRLVVLHCDLGKSPNGHDIEWPGTKELAEEHASHYGLRFIVAKRGVQGFLEKVEDLEHWPRPSTRYCTSFFKRDQGQKVMTQVADEVRKGFLGEIADRGKWPSQAQRYCTSYYKRDPANTAMTGLANEARGFLEQVEYRGMWMSHGQRYCTSKFKQQPGASAVVHLAHEVRSAGKRVPRLLQCFGFRAQESPRRKKMPTFANDKRTTNTRKHVDVWLPIHDWTTEQVWGRIRAAGTKHHYAYDLGMTRLSCRFCIFAPKNQLLISARANPELFAEYVEVEKRIGHKFRMELALADVAHAVSAGEEAGNDDGCWNM